MKARAKNGVRCAVEVLVILGVSLSGVSGCGGAGIERYDAIMTDKVKRKATFDFDCDDIKVVKVDSGTFGATGCGKRATYVGANAMICRPGNYESNLVEHCDVVADLASENASSSKEP